MTVGADDFSATALQTTAKSGAAYEFEVFSDDDFIDGSGQTVPTTCTADDTTVVTCNGWDTNASAEIWMRCDANAPWVQMPGTSTYTAKALVGPVNLGRCQIRLKVVSSGATSSACLYLAGSGGQFPRSGEVQDEDSRGSWAVVP